MIRLTSIAALVTLMLSVTAPPAQADGLRSTSCVGFRGSLSCVTRWQRWDPPTPQRPTEQELAEARERDRQWEARCRPVVRQDNFGVARYVYAAPGCEYGRLN